MTFDKKYIQRLWRFFRFHFYELCFRRRVIRSKSWYRNIQDHYRKYTIAKLLGPWFHSYIDIGLFYLIWYWVMIFLIPICPWTHCPSFPSYQNIFFIYQTLQIIRHIQAPDMKYIYFHVFILTYKNIESGWFTFCKNHNGNRYKLCLVVCHKSNTFDLKCGCEAAAFLLFIKNFTRTYTNISEYILQK